VQFALWSRTRYGLAFPASVIDDLPDKFSVVVGGLGALDSQIEFGQADVVEPDRAVVVDQLRSNVI